MNAVQTFLKQLYGLEGVLTPLDGYANQNYKLVTSDGTKYIVKLSYDINELGIIEAQGNLLTFLSKTENRDIYPQPVLSRNGKMVEVIEDKGEGKATIIRLLTWLEGGLVKEVTHSKNLFEDLGKALGTLDKSLSEFSDPHINQRYSDWDLQHALVTSRDTGFIERPENRRLVEYFFLQYQTSVSPELDFLRKCTIHADANDYNILVKDNHVSGLIDFGDCVHSPIINELAIALAYMLMGKENPVEWAKPLVKGYHSKLPLVTIEIDLLYYLIAGRLAMSVTKSALSRHRHPENEYLQVSETPAWQLLWKWIEINPLDFANIIKEACGIPVGERETIHTLLTARRKHISGSLSISYNQPIAMKKAALQYMSRWPCSSKSSKSWSRTNGINEYKHPIYL